MSSTSLQPWVYRELEIVPPPAPVRPSETAAAPEAEMPAAPGLTEDDVALRVQAALGEAERRWASATEQEDIRRRAQIIAALNEFETERARYWREVEREIVQLALTIARKVVDREASVDPQLLQSLVRSALDRMGAGTTVRLRVAPHEASRWQEHGAFTGAAYVCDVIADSSVEAGTCLVETDLGSASFGLELQMEEIERTVLDVLESRPPSPGRDSAPPSTSTESTGVALAGEAA